MRVSIRPVPAIAILALSAACRRTPPEDVRVDGHPVSEWIAVAVNAENPHGQQIAWQALRHAGPPAVPALRHAMERTTNPELRARIGLAFSFLCPSVLPALREEARTAQGDVQTQLDMVAQAMASRGEATGGQGVKGGAGGC